MQFPFSSCEELVFIAIDSVCEVLESFFPCTGRFLVLFGLPSTCMFWCCR